MPDYEPIQGDGYELKDNGGKDAFIVDTKDRFIEIKNKSSNKSNVILFGDEPQLQMTGNKGAIRIATSPITGLSKAPNIGIDASDASIIAGGGANGKAGKVKVRGANSKDRVTIDGADASIVAGGDGIPGKVYIKDKSNDSITIDGSNAHVTLSGNEPQLQMTGNKVAIRIATSPITGLSKAPNIGIDASDASIIAGGGVNGKAGKVKVRGDNSKDRVTIDGADASIIAGGNDVSGKVDIKDADNYDQIHMDASTAYINVGSYSKSGLVCGLVSIEKWGKKPTGGVPAVEPTRIQLSAEDTSIRAGGPYQSGKLLLRYGGNDSIQADAKDSSLSLGGDNAHGLLKVKHGNDAAVVIDGTDGSVVASCLKTGKVIVNDNSGQPAFILDGEAGDIKAGKVTVTDNNGDPVVILDGGYGITLKDQNNKESILLDAANNAIALCNKQGIEKQMVWLHAATENGGSGINLRNQKGNDTIKVDADNCAIVLSNKYGDEMVWLHADPDNGSSGITLRNQGKYDTIQIDGERGDVILVNADCAEDFDVVEAELAEAGTVMALNIEGKLQQATEPYDSKVAGVVSGAGGFKPGLVLGRSSDKKDRLPIALTGKVYCKVDADYGPVKVGDLLTTSSTPGHAMKAQDSAKAFGAVLGKALAPLAEGRNLIPILVSLQ
jgi:hypothetical protein